MPTEAIDKYHKYISIGIGILFLIAVQLFTTPAPIFRFLVPAVIFLIVATSVYNWYYLRIKQLFNFWVWLRPVLFYVSWFALFALLTNGVWRGLFLLLGILVIYVLEASLGFSGEQLLLNEVLVITFCFFIGIIGFNHYFIQLPLVLFVFLAAAGTSLIVRSSLEAVPTHSSRKWLAAICLALFVAELYWVISFLPFHYSASGLLLFNCFYLIWALLYYSLFNHLTWRKVQFHLLLAFIFVVIMLTVTPWRITS